MLAQCYPNFRGSVRPEDLPFENRRNHDELMVKAEKECVYR